MTERDARFYFLNLGSDVTRCIVAAEKGEEMAYENSLARARKTLASLHDAKRPEAYEEGLLLLRALSLARANGTLQEFRLHLSGLMMPLAARAFA